jgi:hypothetical protein
MQYMGTRRHSYTLQHTLATTCGSAHASIHRELGASDVDTDYVILSPAMPLVRAAGAHACLRADALLSRCLVCRGAGGMGGVNCFRACALAPTCRFRVRVLILM